MDKPKKTEGNRQSQSYDTKATIEYVHLEVNAYTISNTTNQSRRIIESWIWCSGYVQDGIARGTGSLIALNNSDQSNRLLTAKISNHFGFTRRYF
jgi:hypothetical protein